MFGLPTSVSIPVFIAQFLAVFIAVATQDDIRTAVNYYFEGYDKVTVGKAFRGASKCKWTAAITFQFLEGVIGLGTTMLLIMTSDEVVGLMLDFTAVEVS